MDSANLRPYKMFTKDMAPLPAKISLPQNFKHSLPHKLALATKALYR